jgi:hypothetical protein
MYLYKYHLLLKKNIANKKNKLKRTNLSADERLSLHVSIFEKKIFRGFYNLTIITRFLQIKFS